jgi:hypothetical protein
MYLDLVFDIEEIMNFPNNMGLTEKERRLNSFNYRMLNKGMKGEQLRVKHVGRRVCYPGTPKQRRAIRKDLSQFLDYLDFPKTLRNEKSNVYKVVRAMFIYQYIARKNNLLFKIERDRILRAIDEQAIMIEKFKIGLSFEYNLINQIMMVLYKDKQAIDEQNNNCAHTIQHLKDLLNTETNLRYIKRIESLL